MSTEAERQAEINRIGTLWSDGWTRRMADEYLLALNDIPPREIAWGVTQAVKTRTVRPKPAQLRELIEQTRAEVHERRRREAKANSLGEGQGCPHCRREGRRGDWVNGSDTLAYCQEHNTAWQGQVTEIHDQVSDDVMTYDQWLTYALAGRLGTVCQHIAERRIEAHDPQSTTPVADLTRAIRRELDAA